MSTSTIRRGAVDDGVRYLLEHELDFPVYVYRLPPGDELVEVDKFALVVPAEGVGSLSGPPLAAPEADAEVEYDITSVGRDERQAQWVADEVRRVMTGRNPTGGLLYALSVEGHDADDRWSPGPIGVPKLESGIYQVVDSYRVKVSRT